MSHDAESTGMGGRAGRPDGEDLEPGSTAAAQLETAHELARTEALSQLFDRMLGGELTEDTYDRLEEAAQLLVGKEGFLAIVVLTRAMDEEMLNSMGVSAEVQEWLRRLAALYGARLQKARGMSEPLNSENDDWRAINRSVLWDPAAGDYVITTGLKKVNGEVVVVRGGLRSAAGLLRGTLRTLLAVDDLSGLSPELQAELIDGFEELRSRFDSDARTETEAEAQD